MAPSATSPAPASSSPAVESQKQPSFLSTLRALLPTFLCISCVKLLLYKSYASTDFEVHRNWLSITQSLPLSQWYFNATSQWTLDYPPFFAYFEWALGWLAKFLAPEALKLSATPVMSPSILIFQRCTVIGSDILLLLGLAALLSAVGRGASKPRSSSSPLSTSTAQLAGLFVLCSTGLLLVDHIHFQYNGMLLGLLLLALSAAYRGWEGTSLALLLTLILCKHLFLVLAPVWGIWYLSRWARGLCSGRVSFLRSVLNLLGTAALCLGLVAAALGPFIMTDMVQMGSSAAELTPAAVLSLPQLQQIFSRLFPFGRGLVHSYWAPNAWALYLAADKGALAASSFLCSAFFAPQPSHPVGAMHTKAVQQALSKVVTTVIPGAKGYQLAETAYGMAATACSSVQRAKQLAGRDSNKANVSVSFLPDITPQVSIVLVLLAMVPALWVVLRGRRKRGGSSSRTAEVQVQQGERASKGKGERPVQGQEGKGLAEVAAEREETVGSAAQLHLAVIVCYLSSFLFGWHVHEKALLYALIPLAALVPVALQQEEQMQLQEKGRTLASLFQLLALLTHVSLFPLLFLPLEQPFQVAATVAYSVCAACFLPRAQSSAGPASSSSLVHLLSSRIILILVALAASAVYAFWWLQPSFLPSLPFLPLMLFSLLPAPLLLGLWMALYELLLKQDWQ